MASNSLGRSRAVSVMLIASLAMVATLPGRTLGLGLITKSLIGDFQIQRTEFAMMNLWATVIGALFVFITGPALDRIGIRSTSVVVLGLFGGAVLWLAYLPGPGMLLLTLILLRGLGQTSLSLTAVTIMGKSFRQRRSVAMGVFAVLTALLIVGAYEGAGAAVKSGGWQATWQYLGFGILALAVICAFGLREPEASEEVEESGGGTGLTFGEALKSPVLWALTLGIGVYYFSFTGISLWKDNLFESLGFTTGDMGTHAMAIIMGTGLIGNLGCGWLAQKIPVMLLFGISMLLIVICLCLLPFLNGSTGLLYLAMVPFGLGGGAVTVVFFTGFADIFGRAHLGRIQGVAQAATVAASGTGPLAFSLEYDREGSGGSYDLLFYILAPLALAAAIWAFLVRLPNRST